MTIPGAARTTGTAPVPNGQITEARTTGNKDGIGTAYTYDAAQAGPKPSRVWFTMVNGSLTETYYPTLDTVALARLDFLVSDGKKLFADEMTDFQSTVTFLADRALAYHVVSVDAKRHLTITKDVLTDPKSDVLLVHVRLSAPKGAQLYAHILPGLQNSSIGNRISTKGQAVLASAPGAALAFVTSGRWGGKTVAYYLINDGYLQLKRHHRLRTSFTRAGPGRVDATVQLASRDLVAAVGFGASTARALSVARASLKQTFDSVKTLYVAGWQGYAKTLNSLGDKADSDWYIAAETLKASEDKTYPGAIVASLTHPFGQIAPDNPDDHGYVEVWERDLYHIALGLFAAGDQTTANEALDFMARVQETDGSFPRNNFVEYKADGSSLQLDQVADPILLAWRLGRQDLYSTMVKRAADFIVTNGPSTPQERWEETGGYSPSTIAAEIAGLVAAADMASRAGDTAGQSKYLATADSWESQVESWTYTTTGPLGNHQYYLRITQGDPNSDLSLSVGGTGYDQRSIVDAGFLELVGLGIRSARDPHILASLPVVDQAIESDTARGPVWHRYNHDVYGDPPPGSASGQGRGWPVLGSERAMYDLIAADAADAQAILRAEEQFAGPEGLIPEQVYEDTGGPTTSARPLNWAQGEYLVLQRSLVDEKPFDMPSIVARRYADRSGS
jgi:glucoamylase